MRLPRIPRPWLRGFGLAISFFLLFITYRSFQSGYDVSYENEDNDQWSDFEVLITGNDDVKNFAQAVTQKTEKLLEKPVESKEKECKVPKLALSSPEIDKFFVNSPKLTCDSKGIKDWAYLDENRRFQLKPEYQQAECEARPIQRITDEKSKEGSAITINPGDKLPADAVIIRCWRNLLEWFWPWKGYFLDVIRDEKLVVEQKSKIRGSQKPMDVFIFSFDSISQMTFRRKLPKTIEFLEQVMQAAVFTAYNIVGDGTPQAFIPMLTAKTELELPLTRKRFDKASFVDEVYPLIWRNFSDAGYVTAFSEDVASVGMFSYRLKGFRKQPTDHFPQTFYQKLESDRWTQSLCVGEVPIQKLWLDYAREFFAKYEDVPKFSLLHSCIFSHDDINLVGGIDDDLLSMFKQMFTKGLFDNAFVFVMADHGHRFAKLRETHQGQLEERLPFFSISLPKSFREGPGRQIWENIMRNREILSTPFDVHATLMDILQMPLGDQVSHIQEATPRSLSLLRPIPISRTCEQAGVDLHWCTCLDWQDALGGSNKEAEMAKRIGHTVAQAFSNITRDERKLCSPLKLKKLHYVKKMITNSALLKYKNVKDEDGFVPDLKGTTKVAFVNYQLKLETTPGDAIYEVTLQHVIAKNLLKIDLTSVSHVNKYGDKPHCIIDRNYFLATYCVCYDKI